MIKKVKNIIFDLGGIFIDINYKKTEDAFVQLGITNFSEYYKQDFVSTLFNDLEVGKIDEIEFYNQFRVLTNSSLTDEQIESAWNALMGDFFIERLEWLNTINKKYNCYLLSNTNIIHYNWFIEHYKKLNAAQALSDYFIKDYYSHTLHLRKPNVESYLHIIDEQKLDITETLFIDDTLKNILGAREAGLQTLLVLPHQDLLVEVENYLALKT